MQKIFTTEAMEEKGCCIYYTLYNYLLNISLNQMLRRERKVISLQTDLQSDHNKTDLIRIKFEYKLT